MSDMLTDVAAKFYKAVREIGSGAYGSVWEVEHKSTGVHFAMKFMKRDAWQYQGNAEKELTILHKVRNHKNLAKWFDMALSGERFEKGEGYKFQTLTMELCDMDLTVYVREYCIRRLDNCFDVAKQVMDGVVFLHTHAPQIIHRDIKPENILVKKYVHAQEKRS